MAKLTRVTQRAFASTAGALQVGQFGSLANGSINYSTDPAVIQALADWVNGWFDAVLGDGNPCIEDMNGIFFVAFYQIGYTLQQGVPEWDPGTTYYVGSIVQDGTGVQYLSTLDTNLNNPLATAAWFPIGTVGPLNATVGNVTMPASRRVTSPSPVTLAATSTVNVPSTSIVFVPESVTVPAGSSLIVAPGGSVRII